MISAFKAELSIIKQEEYIQVDKLSFHAKKNGHSPLCEKGVIKKYFFKESQGNNIFELNPYHVGVKYSLITWGGGCPNYW